MFGKKKSPSWKSRGYVNSLIVFGLVDKFIKLSDSQFHNGNLNLIRMFLIANDYPDSFIDIQIKKRLKLLKNTHDNNSSNKKSFDCNKTRIVIPFYKYITPLINKLAEIQIL